MAETINAIVNNVNWNQGNSWTALWGNIFAQRNVTAFDDAITQDVDSGNFLDALFVARLAYLNNYSSPILAAETQEALQRVDMTGSLPVTGNAKAYGDPGSGAFLVYDRYLVYCYLLAEEYGLAEKWNATQAYQEFKTAYLKPPSGSESGEMLWIDPAQNWAKSFSSRYYDEHAETMDMFMSFADIGIPEAMAYAADSWENVQAHWNGQYYGYTGQSTVECEMANFAEIAAAYQLLNGQTIPYWDRIFADLNYKLLAKGWGSPGWSQPGVIVHATSNPQLRLWETTSVIIAFQQLHPYFTDQMKSNFTDMLMGEKPAWKGLINSALNVNGSFIGAGGLSPSIEATVDAAATLFLEGIVPVNGNLAIPFSNEQYQDYRTPFQIQDFQFDYANRLITIPVNAGTLTFIYGSNPVNYTFPANGTYTVQFSSDWNSILEVTDGKSYTSPNLIITLDGAPALSWFFPNATQGQEYQIYRGNFSGAETLIAVTNSSSFVDYEAINGNDYCYYVSTGENQTNTVNVTFDYAPAVSSQNNQGWHTQDFEVNLSVPKESGEVSINYRINQGQTRNVSSDGQPWITSESASNILEYWSVSPLGTKQSKHVLLTDLMLDKTAPAASVSIDNGAEYTFDAAVTLNLFASDTSGITAMRFSNDNASWSDWEAYGSSEKGWTLSDPAGNKTIYAQVQNGAGLTSTCTSSIMLATLTPNATPPPNPTAHPTKTTLTPTATPTPTPIPEFSFLILLTLCIISLASVLCFKAVTNPKKRHQCI